MDKLTYKLNVLVSLLLAASLVNAEMRPIEDAELSEYVGQAAVAFDIDQIGTNSYTRVTLGMEADLQMNINNVELGNYAITYKISGMLTDVKSLITVRSNLNRSVAKPSAFAFATYFFCSSGVVCTGACTA